MPTAARASFFRWSKVGGNWRRGRPQKGVQRVLGLANRLLEGHGGGVDAFFVSNVTDSISKLDYQWQQPTPSADGVTPARAVLARLMEWCEANGLDKFTPQGMGCLVSGLARAGAKPSEAMLAQLIAQVEAKGFDGFKPQEMANVVSGLAKLSPRPGEGVLRRLEEDLLARGFAEFQPQELAMLISALARMRARPSEALTRKLVSVLEAKGLGGFNAQGFAMVVSGLANMRMTGLSGRVKAKISEELEARDLSLFSTQNMANVLMGMAKLRYTPTRSVLRRVSEELERSWMERFTTQELSNIINALAKLEVRPGDGLAKQLSNELARRGFAGFTAQEMANVVNGFAALRMSPGRATLQQLATEMERRDAAKLTPDAMAKLIQGLATLRHRPGDGLLRRLSEQVQARAGVGGGDLLASSSFKVTDLIGMLHGFADLGSPSHGSWLAARVASEMETGGAGGVADSADMLEQVMLASGCARLGVPPGEAVVQELWQRMEDRGLSALRADGLAEVVSAMAEMGGHSPSTRLLDMVLREWEARGIDSFSARALSRAAGGLARLRYHPGEKLLSLMCSHAALREGAGGSGEDLGGLLYALAVFKHRPSEAVMSALREVTWQPMAGGEAVRLAWAVSAMGLPLDEQLLEAAVSGLREAFSAGEDLTAPATALRQAMALSGIDADEDMRSVVDRMTGWRASAAADGQVGGVLAGAMGGMLHVEQQGAALLGGDVAVDAVVSRSGRRVAVVVDGETHFFRNREREATGEAEARWRLLDRAVERGELQAWVALPWWEVEQEEGAVRRRVEAAMEQRTD